MVIENGAYRVAEKTIRNAARYGRTSLNLGGNDSIFADLKALPPEIADLEELETLDLNCTQVRDITPLGKLIHLRKLTMEATQVTDIAPLRDMLELRELRIGHNKISDISPISRLSKLTILSLNSIQVSDILPLKELTDLNTLWLNGTRVSDITSLLELQNLRRLFLNSTSVDDITPLLHLIHLEYLSLGHTRVTNISTLHHLNELRTLSLDNTEISDLRPIKNHRNLLELDNSQLGKAGLNIDNSRACLDDPEGLGRLSKIKGDLERTRAILDYLNALPEDWTPSVNSEPPTEITIPEQDDVLRVVPNPTSDGQLDVEPAHPSPDEQDERLKQKLYTRLRARLKDLSAATGNQHYRITQMVQGFLAQLPENFAEADQVDIYLELDSLRGLYDRRDTIGEDGPLPETAVSALHDINTLGPGLVLDNEKVDLLEARRRRFADILAPETDQTLQDDISKSIVEDDDAFGPTLRGYQSHVLIGGNAVSSRRSIVQRILNRNTVIATARYVLDNAGKGAISGIAGAGAVWLVKHPEIVTAYAASQGDMFLIWIRPIIHQAQELVAAAQTSGLPGRIPPRH